MTDDKKPNPFNIIRNRGYPQLAEFEGITVVRQERLFIREWGGLVSCAPYDDHFIFQVPRSRLRPGMSEYMCTCGAAAIVRSPELQSSRLFVCAMHATFGHHSTHYVNKDDFGQKDLSGTIDVSSKKYGKPIN